MFINVERIGITPLIFFEQFQRLLIVNIKQQSATFSPRNLQNNAEECHIFSRPTFNPPTRPTAKPKSTRRHIEMMTSSKSFTFCPVVFLFFGSENQLVFKCRCRRLSYFMYNIQSTHLIYQRHRRVTQMLSVRSAAVSTCASSFSL